MEWFLLVAGVIMVVLVIARGALQVAAILMKPENRN